MEDPTRLVFLDETSVDLRVTYRLMGWSLVGLRAQRSEGLVYTKIIVGPYDGDSFVRYIENLVEHMNPYPAPKSILLMDNCSIHHVEGVSELCSAR
ncbi:hypothetical protein BJ322DRAFT_1011813 [Thelephora terrestris]|uniref:Tc1-like transposase DDE domain-containing protein n=1 Tax=Thelephora terrestris TaxID=56493 RepID=A0A9P6H8I8_9AGAM|nr:hypothetical protein BJ322DRAFT_1011813 [Thelephora terrestris]